MILQLTWEKRFTSTNCQKCNHSTMQVHSRLCGCVHGVIYTLSVSGQALWTRRSVGWTGEKLHVGAVLQNIRLLKNSTIESNSVIFITFWRLSYRICWNCIHSSHDWSLSGDKMCLNYEKHRCQKELKYIKTQNLGKNITESGKTRFHNAQIKLCC